MITKQIYLFLWHQADYRLVLFIWKGTGGAGSMGMDVLEVNTPGELVLWLHLAQLKVSIQGIIESWWV